MPESKASVEIFEGRREALIASTCDERRLWCVTVADKQWWGLSSTAHRFKLGLLERLIGEDVKPLTREQCQVAMAEELRAKEEQPAS